MNNTPKLRFKDENGENYPKWSIDILGNRGTIVTGGTPPKEHPEHFERVEGVKIPWITPSDISSKKDIEIGERSLSEVGFEKQVTLEKDTLLITCIASIGKNAILRKKGSCNQQINALTPNKNNNVDFLYYLIEKNADYMLKYAGQTATPILNKKSLSMLKFKFPSLPEQEKIASFLSLFDEKIELQEKKVESLKKYKKGMMQKIFSQEIRFKDENGEDYPEWEDKKLGDIISQKSIRNKKNEVDLVLSVSNSKGFILQAEQFEDRVVASSDVSNYKIVNRGDFAYNPARINVGSIARLIDKECGIVSPMYICFKCNSQVNEIFVELFFSTHRFKTQMEARLEGSVRKTLSYEALSNIKINLPSLPEQEKIASFLSEIDNKIELEQDKLDKLKEHKKGLLQQMFI